LEQLNHRPRVSVIIPTYNREHLISRAIQSVQHQTYQDFEMIVVDDGSTDHTEEMASSFRDEKIRYLRHDQNKGLPAARNTGIRAAKGEYVAFLDDDDDWFPTKLEKQVNQFEKSNEKIGVIYTGFLLKAQHTGKILAEVIPTLRGEVYRDLLNGNILHVSTSMIKKIGLEQVGFFDESFLSFEDWDLWMRLSKHYEFDFIPEALVTYYILGTQMTANLNLRIQGMERLIEKSHLDFKNCPSVLAKHLKRIGRWHILSGNIREGRRCFLNSIRADPFKKSAYLQFLLSMIPSSIQRKVLERYYVKKVEGGILYR
jgi:glycosyltransferase involved in cell wall biosynthesis